MTRADRQLDLKQSGSIISHPPFQFMAEQTKI